MSFVDFHVARDILATCPSYNELRLFLILTLAIIKAVHAYNSNTYKKNHIQEPMSSLSYKNNSEMSWVQQQIASLLNLNINRLMISLYSRNLDPFILSLYCPRRI